MILNAHEYEIYLQMKVHERSDWEGLKGRYFTRWYKVDTHLGQRFFNDTQFADGFERERARVCKTHKLERIIIITWEKNV